MYHLIYDRTTKQHSLNCQSSLSNIFATNQYSRLALSPSTSFQRKHSKQIKSISLDNTSQRFLLSAGSDASILLYDLQTKHDDMIKLCGVIKRDIAHKYTISTIQWYPFDNGIFSTSSNDTTLKVWDASYLQNVCAFALESHVTCHDMAKKDQFHNLIAAAVDKQIRLCDMNSAACSHTLLGHEGKIHCVRWSPRDPYTILSSGEDQFMKEWDIRKANCCVKTYKLKDDVTSVTYISDGHSFIALSRRGVIYHVDTHSDRYLSHFASSNPFRETTHPVITNVKECNPPLMYVPTNNRVILVYDLNTGLKVGQLVGHFDKVSCLALQSNRQCLISGGNDNELILWEPKVPDEDETEDSKDDWGD